jgi:hypothetical protein
VDRLLHLLNAEREYIQLHRDSTVQSLLLVPLLENGRIVYQGEGVVLVLNLKLDKLCNIE